MLSPDWDGVFESLSDAKDLTSDQTSWAMSQILSGSAETEIIKKFLLSLKNKGESPQEVIDLVETMYQHAQLINIPDRCVDVVGTGGDGANTINISTAAAIITTAAGARTIKHGNRAATSKAGQRIY